MAPLVNLESGPRGEKKTPGEKEVEPRGSRMIVLHWTIHAANGSRPRFLARLALCRSPSPLSAIAAGGSLHGTPG